MSRQPGGKRHWVRSSASRPEGAHGNKPEVMIGQAQTKFDENGRLTDEPTRDFARQLLESLTAWTNRLR